MTNVLLLLILFALAPGLLLLGLRLLLIALFLGVLYVIYALYDTAGFLIDMAMIWGFYLWIGRASLPRPSPARIMFWLGYLFAAGRNWRLKA